MRTRRPPTAREWMAHRSVVVTGIAALAFFAALQWGNDRQQQLAFTATWLLIMHSMVWIFAAQWPTSEGKPAGEV